MAIKFLDSAGLTYFINKIVYGITSPKFSTGSTYAVGDFVIYTGKLYRCTTAVTVAGAWSASKWVQTTVKDEIKALNTNLTALEDNLPFIQPVQVRAFVSFSNATWTATEDCVIVGSFYQPASSTGGSVSIAGVSIGVRIVSTESNFPIYIPIKQGQVFGIGSVGVFNGGAYKLYGR